MPVHLADHQGAAGVCTNTCLTVLCSGRCRHTCGVMSSGKDREWQCSLIPECHSGINHGAVVYCRHRAFSSIHFVIWQRESVGVKKKWNGGAPSIWVCVGFKWLEFWKLISRKLMTFCFEAAQLCQVAIGVQTAEEFYSNSRRSAECSGSIAPRSSSSQALV